MAIVLSSSRTSTRGSLSSFISLICALEGLRLGLRFPNSLKTGFPSGPVVMEKP